jgi:hypothetical protein
LVMGRKYASLEVIDVIHPCSSSPPVSARPSPHSRLTIFAPLCSESDRVGSSKGKRKIVKTF